MNNTYILLRNNSESTPLSLEDLKRIGLLPTDLLWVECQSVCWQKPQEIPELKQLLTLAPQPSIKPATDEQPEKYAPPVETETAAATHKNRVHVELPSNYKSLTKMKEEPAQVKQESPAWQTETKTPGTVNNNDSNNHLSSNDSQPDEGSKDPWIRNHAPKDKTEMLESLLKLPPKKIALYAGLVIAGALMMLVIKGTGGHEQMRPQPVTQQTEIVKTTPAEVPAEEQAADSTTTPESYAQQNIPIGQPTTNPAEEKKISAPQKNETTAKNTVTKKESTPVSNETTDTKPVAVAEKKEVKKASVENISSKLQLKANEYSVAAFGGIRNLKMTLQNDSRYLLDKVSVELNYLNPEGKVVKTEKIDFNYIQPGAEATIAVNKTSRGVKLDYKITSIELKETAANNSAAGENNIFSKN
ncbi:MAG: hypothetical protein IPQ25_15120 [Chitinophagaceae bacterium]|nr:hypothetical protein [Chitinophagaceae bacterium]